MNSLLLQEKDLAIFFDKILQNLSCRPETQSYIISIYHKFKSSEFDYSNQSITLLYAHARERQDFLTFQNVGDWLFWSNTIFPESLKDANKNYYDNIGRLAYYSCYRLIQRKWFLFEELSDNFSFLENQVKDRLKKQI